jgi:hypothetical protein
MPCRQTLDTHDIHQEADQLERLFGQRIGAGAQVGIIVEQVWQVVPQHAAAGTRRYNDIVVTAKRIEDAFGKIACRGAISRVVGGLPAAGLSARYLNLASCQFQQADRCEANGRAMKID